MDDLYTMMSYSELMAAYRAQNYNPNANNGHSSNCDCCDCCDCCDGCCDCMSDECGCVVGLICCGVAGYFIGKFMGWF